MGSALARAASMLGADVTVIAGPSDVPLPRAATVFRVQTASEMLEAAMAHADKAQMIIGAAAVADYRPARKADGKIRSGETGLSLELVPNPDILAELAAAARPGTKVIAFAAEPDSNLETARAKLARKGAYAIAHNDIGRTDIGFEHDWNELTLITADGRLAQSGRRSKLACGLWLFQQLAD